MKLKTYRILLLSILSILLLINIYFIIDTIIYTFLTKELTPSDIIVSFICLILSLIFIIMEIINTIYSIKHNNSYIKNITYENDEEEILNNKTIYGSLVFSLFFFIFSIYIVLVLIGINLPFLDIATPQKEVILILLLVLSFDLLFIFLFKFINEKERNKLNNKKSSNK